MEPAKLNQAFQQVASEGKVLGDDDLKFASSLWPVSKNYLEIATAILLKNSINGKVTLRSEEYLKYAHQIGGGLVGLVQSQCHLLAQKILLEKKDNTETKVQTVSNVLKRIAEEVSTKPINADKIGSGLSGVVYRVNSVGGEALSNIALKVSLDDPDAVKDTLSEIACLKRIHASPKLTEEEKLKIVPEPVQVTYKGKVGYLTTLYQGGDLKKYMIDNPLTLTQKREFAKQLIEQMAILSKAGLVYTDIKLENVLVDTSTKPPTLRLTDFGNCFFADTPEEFSGHYIFSSILQVDHKELLKPHIFSKTKEEKVEALTKAANTHMARGLSLLLIKFFSEEEFTYVDPHSLDPTAINGCSEGDLLRFVQDHTLAELTNEDNNLRTVIFTMMMGSLSPQDALKQIRS